MLPNDIQAYNNKQKPNDQAICQLLSQTIESSPGWTEAKIWHAHPVRFIDGNPIVGYSKLKDSVRLFFRSGQSFDESVLQAEGTFKSASIRYMQADQIDTKLVLKLLEKAKFIQWDYKNIVKHKGKLEKLTNF